MKKLLFISLIFSLLSFIYLLLPSTSYALCVPPEIEGIDSSGNPICITSSGTPGSPGGGDNFFNILNPTGITELGGTGLLKIVLTLLLVVAGIAALIFLIIGGIRWIAAGGDPKNLAAARQTIINALIGLIIVVAAYAIAKALEGVFGISIVGGLKVF